MTFKEEKESVMMDSDILMLLKELYGDDIADFYSVGYWWFVWRILPCAWRKEGEWICDVYNTNEILFEVRCDSGLNNFKNEIVKKLTELKIKKDENSCNQ